LNIPYTSEPEALTAVLPRQRLRDTFLAADME